MNKRIGFEVSANSEIRVIKNCGAANVVRLKSEVPEHVRIILEAFQPLLLKQKYPFAVCPEHLKVLIEAAVEWIFNESQGKYLGEDVRVDRLIEKAKAANLIFGKERNTRDQ